MGVYIRNITKEQFIEDCNAMGVLVITEGISEIDLVRCGECKWWNNGFCNNGRADANLKLEGNCFCDEGERRADEHTD